MVSETEHVGVRDNNITFIRTMTMILVVLGHSFNIIQQTESWGRIAQRIIYTFHMPLFMSVSGYLFYYEIERSLQLQDGERKRNVLYFIYKKIWRLIVPFVLVMYLWKKPLSYLTGAQDIPGSIKELFMFHSTGHLWYLYVLFAIFVFEKLFMWCIWVNRNHLMITLIGMFVFAYLGYFMHGTVHHFMVYNFYFFIGIVINKYFDKILNLKKHISVFLFGLTLCTTVFLVFSQLADIIMLDALLHIGVALVDIVIIYALTAPLRNRQISEWISVMDKHGMGIYLFHTGFIQLLAKITAGLPINLAWLCIFIGSFLLSFFMTFLFKKVGIKMILGEFRPKWLIST